LVFFFFFALSFVCVETKIRIWVFLFFFALPFVCFVERKTLNFLCRYALWYFHKACALRPGDARMWVALGGCFEKSGRAADAIRCFERAVAAGDGE
jgi:hypothetical protein